MAGMGDNELKALKALVDDIVALERERIAARKLRKEEISGLRAAKLPATHMVNMHRLMREDAEKVAEDREKARVAAAILGVKAYVAESAPLEGDQLPARDKIAYAKSAMSVIEGQDEEIAELSEDIKAKYVSVKGMGADVSIVRRLVRHTLNPEDLDARDSADALFQTYLANLNKVGAKVEEREEEDEEAY